MLLSHTAQREGELLTFLRGELAQTRNGAYSSFRCSHTLSDTGQKSPTSGDGHRSYAKCSALPASAVSKKARNQRPFIKNPSHQYNIGGREKYAGKTPKGTPAESSCRSGWRSS